MLYNFDQTFRNTKTYKLQNELFDCLDVESSKDQNFTKNLKIKYMCLLYLAPRCCHRLS